MTCSEDPLPHNCLGCQRLPKCKRVTPKMLAERDSCELHEDATSAEYIARARILEQFGPGALLPEPNPRKSLHEEKYDMAATRPTLRKLAMAAGLIERSPESFELDAEELIDILSEKFEDISDMDNDDVKELIADLNSEGGDDEDEEPKKKTARKRTTRKKKADDDEPAKKTTRKRRTTRKKKKADEPEDEEEAEEKAEPAKKTTTRKRRTRKTAAKKTDEPKDEPAKKTTTRKRRTRKAAPKDEPKDEPKGDENAVAQVDLGPAVERLDTIGTELDKVSKKVASKAEKKQIAELKGELEAVKEDVAAVDTKVDAIVMALTEMYNEGFEDEDDQVDSILELVEEEGE